MQPAPESDVPLDRGTLVARGYQEAITYSFVEETLQKAFSPELRRLRSRSYFLR